MVVSKEEFRESVKKLILKRAAVDAGVAESSHAYFLKKLGKVSTSSGHGFYEEYPDVFLYLGDVREWDSADYSDFHLAGREPSEELIDLWEGWVRASLASRVETSQVGLEV